MLILLYSCGADQSFRNLEGVDYVGMQTCKSCHADVHETYQHTGMGYSFGHATKDRSIGEFGENHVVFDSATNFYYQPFLQNDSLYIEEYRLAGGAKTHSRIEKIHYIIGSGQHTNSHLMDINGYIFQAPITFYAQARKWDMAPGFEKGGNSRFSREIMQECLTCHNHFPEPEAGAMNKFKTMPTGIECERCHGPGALHVKEKMAGKIVDTTGKGVDYSIVNPRHLPRDLQMDLCQRCHLQGVAVLNDGKTFYDFKPGMSLSSVMNVFLPRYSDNHERFIMASQADRLRLSDCYLKSNDLSCITCHSPHISVKNTPASKYNSACAGCHQQKKCSEPLDNRKKFEDNCVKCHMPRSGSIDIPHVTITDHFISKKTAQKSPGEVKPTISEEKKKEISQFIELKCMTTAKPDGLLKAKGLVATYDKFIKDRMLLDSALICLRQYGEFKNEAFPTFIHVLFAKEDYRQIINNHQKIPLLDLSDSWTLYRIGEAFYHNGESRSALPYWEKCVKQEYNNLNFKLKLANVYMDIKQFPRAEKLYREITLANPKMEQAWCNLGFCLANMGKYPESMSCYSRALALNPDYEQAKVNKQALQEVMGK